VIIETSEYIRCELDEAARREMVVKLEDFLRRRSKIALVVRQEEIRAAPGLLEACRILFGEEQLEAKIGEYFGSAAAPACDRRPQAWFRRGAAANSAPWPERGHTSMSERLLRVPVAERFQHPCAPLFRAARQSDADLGPKQPSPTSSARPRSRRARTTGFPSRSSQTHLR